MKGLGSGLEGEAPSRPMFRYSNAACIRWLTVLVFLLTNSSGFSEEKKKKKWLKPVDAIGWATDALNKETAGIRINKPDHFNSWGERADYIEKTLNDAYNDYLQRVDNHFGSDLDETEELDLPQSNFKLGIEVQYEEDRGPQFQLNYNFDTDIHLPRIEKKMRLFMRTTDLGELPGSDPADVDNDFQIGIGRTRELLNSLLDTRVGIKARWPPVGFLEGVIRRSWDGDDWTIVPRQKFFYETDNGFGEISSLAGTRWLSEHVVGRTISAVRWTEKTDGVEWEQTLMLQNLFAQLVEGERKTDLFKAHKGIGFRYSVFGHKNSSFLVDRHRISFPFRWPVYEKWIYTTITPEVNWRNENDWSTDSGIRIGFELLFWGLS